MRELVIGVWLGLPEAMRKTGAGYLHGAIVRQKTLSNHEANQKDYSEQTQAKRPTFLIDFLAQSRAS